MSREITLYDFYTLIGCDDKVCIEVFNETSNEIIIEKDKRFFIFGLEKSPEQYIVTNWNLTNNRITVKTN